MTKTMRFFEADSVEFESDSPLINPLVKQYN